MNYLIYGHSQSGGMGLDFQKQLKKAGHTVDRVTKVGWNDAKLLSNIPSLGDVSKYDGVYFFGGGNNDKPTPDTLLKIVDSLGGKDKVMVILPPYNDSKESPDVMTDPTTKGFANQKALENNGVTVFRRLFPSDAFWPDKIHLKPYTKFSSDFAMEVLNSKHGSVNSDWATIGYLAVAGFAVAYVINTIRNSRQTQE